MTTEYVTVPNVPLMTVGIEWPGTPGASGSTTFALEDLVEMVAAEEDPLIRAARVKLGHAPWQPHPDGGVVRLGDGDPFWDGEPCFGSVKNLRIDDDGVRLIGDLVEVPDWLAAVMPSAWPNRSIEWRDHIETEGGRRYERVLTAVGLLGVREQAVKDLSDIRRVLDGDPELVEYPDL